MPLSETYQIPSTTEQKLRDLVLPLAQKIALCRAKESKSDTSTILTRVNSGAVTHQALAEFTKQLVELRKDLCDHGSDVISIKHGHCPENISVNATSAEIPVCSPHEVVHRNERLESQARESKRISHFDLRMPCPEFRDKKYSELRNSRRRTPSPMHRRGSGDIEHKRNHHTGNDLELSEHRYSSRVREPLHHTAWSRKNGPQHTRSEGFRRRSRSRSPVISRNHAKRRDRSRSYSPRRLQARETRSRLIKQPHLDRDFRRRSDDSEAMQASDLRPLPPEDIPDHMNLSICDATLPVQKSESKLPCHNVPGLWFASQGLNELGTSTIEFEVDEEAATKWNIPMNRWIKCSCPISTFI